MVLDGIGKFWSDAIGCVSVDRHGSGLDQNPADHRTARNGNGDSRLHGRLMTDEPIDNEMPAEIDFGKAVHGHHQIPAEASVFLPVSIERSVWEYFSDKAQRKDIGLSQLLSDVLNRDIEINEALK